MKLIIQYQSVFSSILNNNVWILNWIRFSLTFKVNWIVLKF